jgi:hypothetical protein
MKIKVYYFDIFGKADAIRMILTHAKVPFDDVRVNGDDIKALKQAGKLEFG